eukprot:70374-Pleurochrysis_carterae.AAC.1
MPKLYSTVYIPLIHLIHLRLSLLRSCSLQFRTRSPPLRSLQAIVPFGPVRLPRRRLRPLHPLLPRPKCASASEPRAPFLAVVNTSR